MQFLLLGTFLAMCQQQNKKTLKTVLARTTQKFYKPSKTFFPIFQDVFSLQNKNRAKELKLAGTHVYVKGPFEGKPHSNHI